MTHPKHQYRRHRALATVAALTCLAPVLVGCSNNDEPDPIPEATKTTSPTPSEPPSSEPKWESKYNEQELAAYEAALDRWTEYETKAEPIWAAGEATPRAEALFEKYWADPAWRVIPYAQLQTYESVEVKSEGVPTVLWSRAKRIQAQGETGSVVFVQCVDYTTVTTTQFGKPVEREEAFAKPVLRTVDVSRAEGYPWLIYNLTEPTLKNFKRCNGEEAP